MAPLADRAGVHLKSPELSPQGDIRLAHHAFPLLHLRLDEGAKVLRRVLAELDVERVESIDHLLLPQYRVQARVELGNDRGRGSGRYEYAVPFVSLEPGQRLRNGWNLRQSAQPPPPGMRDGSQCAALDVSYRCRTIG